MRKFLQICEELDPTNNASPKWTLVDFLKSKGINVSVVRDTDMLYIDTGEQTIAVTVNSNEEEAEDFSGTNEVDNEVDHLADKAGKPMSGTAKKLYGQSSMQAAGAVKERQGLSQQAISAYRKKTDQLKKGLINVQKNPTVNPTV